jgi:hypothetical protein
MYPARCIANAAIGCIKPPSLLAFGDQRTDQNLKNLFEIHQVPSDRQMKEILALLEPVDLRPLSQDLIFGRPF